MIDGKVDLLEHSRFALTDEEKAQGLILACCAIPTTDVIVAWLAGGSGLAPIKGIVEAAIARGMKQPIHVYFGARSGRDLYLVNYFERLAERHPNLAFTPVLSYAPLDASAPWRTGLVTDVIAKDFQDFDGWKAYVAGPPPMVEASMQICRARGLRSQDLHADVFFTPVAASALGNSSSFSGGI